MANTNTKLQEVVIDTLDSAVKDGYDLTEFNVAEIAEGIKEYNSKLATYHPVMLYPHISQWLKNQQLH